MPKSYKIYYCRWLYKDYSDSKSQLEIKITSIFGIPFYNIVDHNPVYSGTWLPFLGLKELSIEDKKQITDPNSDITQCNELMLKILKKPPSMDDNFFNELIFDDKRNRAIILGNFVTIKCMLISAALGGGLWDLPLGKKLLQCITEYHRSFFENYLFQLVDSKMTFNPIANGVAIYSDNIKTYMNEVNERLNLSMNMKMILRDVREVLVAGKEPLTLQLGQMKINSAFPKQFPDVQKITCKYSLSYNANINNDSIKAFEFVKNNYDKLINYFNSEDGEDSLNVTYEVDQHTIIFLRNGHVLYYDASSEVFVDNDSRKVFCAYSPTEGNNNVIKVSKSWRKDVLKSTIVAGNKSFIQPIKSVFALELKKDISTATVSDLYHYDLYTLLDTRRLSFVAIEEVFCSLLRGLSNFHNTPILFGGKIEGKMYHGDIKLENIFVFLKNRSSLYINSKEINVFFGDLDSVSLFGSYIYTLTNLDPYLARAIERINDIKSEPTMEHNHSYSRAADVWSLGITLSQLLMSKKIRRSHNSSVPIMNFMHSILTNSLNKADHIRYIANIKQSDIDDEINEIKDIISKQVLNPVERKKLYVMWDTVQSMLQVDPKCRPNIFDISNKCRNQLRECELRKMKQTKITDYFKAPIKEKEQIKPESNKSGLKEIAIAIKNFIQQSISFIISNLKLLASYIGNLFYLKPKPAKVEASNPENNVQPENTINLEKKSNQVKKEPKLKQQNLLAFGFTITKNNNTGDKKSSTNLSNTNGVSSTEVNNTDQRINIGY